MCRLPCSGSSRGNTRVTLEPRLAFPSNSSRCAIHVAVFRPLFSSTYYLLSSNRLDQTCVNRFFIHLLNLQHPRVLYEDWATIVRTYKPAAAPGRNSFGIEFVACQPGRSWLLTKGVVTAKMPDMRIRLCCASRVFARHLCRSLLYNLGMYEGQ